MSGEVATMEGQPTLPGMAPDAETASLLRELYAGHEDGETVLRRRPTEVERRQLQIRARDLETALRPLEPSNREEWRRAKQVLAFTLGGWSAFRDDPDGMADIFREHCRGLPLWALTMACEDVVHNRADFSDGRGGRRKLVPGQPISSNMVRALAERRVARHADELRRVHEVLSARRELRPPQSAEERERVGAGLRRLADDLRRRGAAMATDDAADAASRVETARRANERAIEAEYRSAGIAEPLRNPDGTVVSLSMALRMGYAIGRDEDGLAVLLSPPGAGKRRASS